MKEISNEKIEIGGVEYTLFLNRQGLVAWEKYCKEELQEVNTLKEKYISDEEELEIEKGTNPFDCVENFDEMDDDSKKMSQMFRKLYWIMLYTNHKLDFDEVNELYDEACKVYGEAQLSLLAQQMIEDINTNKVQQNQLKNLNALRQKN